MGVPRDLDREIDRRSALGPDTAASRGHARVLGGQDAYLLACAVSFDAYGDTRPRNTASECAGTTKAYGIAVSVSISFPAESKYLAWKSYLGNSASLEI